MMNSYTIDIRNIDISTVSHEQLKADSGKVKAIIRTGELNLCKCDIKEWRSILKG